MRRVLVVVDNFFPKHDGVMRFIEEVVPPLAKDFKITILAANYDGKKFKTWNGIPIFKFLVFRGIKILDYSPVLPNPFVVWREVKKSDVIFVQTITSAYTVPLSIIFGRLQRKKIVCYFHQKGWEQYYIHTRRKWGTKIAGMSEKVVKFISKFYGNMCDLFLISSEEMVSVLEKVGIRTKAEIVGLGVDIKEFKPARIKAKSKQKVDIDKKKFVIGYCGRVSYDKDIDTLVSAFNLFKEKHKNAMLLLVGDGDKAHDMLKDTHSIYLTGFVENVADYYKAMDIFVLPSLTETTGLVLPEAMASGVACITTPVGFAQTHVSKGYNALLFGPKDVEGLVEQMELLYKDKKLRKHLARNARKTIEEGFTWNKTIKDLKRILKEV